ncbi:Hypothetical predicted protein, partial [Marmota monax]
LKQLQHKGVQDTGAAVSMRKWNRATVTTYFVHSQPRPFINGRSTGQTQAARPASAP